MNPPGSPAAAATGHHQLEMTDNIASADGKNGNDSNGGGQDGAPNLPSPSPPREGMQGGDATQQTLRENARTAMREVRDRAMETLARLQAELKSQGVSKESVEVQVRALKAKFDAATTPEALEAQAAMLKENVMEIAGRAGLDRDKMIEIEAAAVTAKAELMRILDIDEAKEKKIREALAKLKAKAGEAAKAVAAQAKRIAENPEEAKVVAKEITDKVAEKLAEGARYGMKQVDDIRQMDQKELVDKGREALDKGKKVLKQATTRYMQLKQFRAIVKHRIGSLKRRLKHALVHEIEAGIGDVYTLEAKKSKGFDEVNPEVLVPALLTPTSLALSQLANYTYLVFTVPIFIAYLIILAVERKKECEIGDGTSIQDLFITKAFLDAFYILPTFGLAYWVSSLQRSHREAEEEDDAADDAALDVDDDIMDVIGQREVIQTRAVRAIAFLEGHDRYMTSYLKHFRDVFAVAANIYDFFFVMTFNDYERTNCDRCTDLSLYKAMNVISTFYVGTFIFRLLIGLTFVILAFLNTPCMRSFLIRQAEAIDDETGFRVAAFLLRNVIFRPLVKDRKAQEAREEMRRKRILLKRRNEIVDELTKINGELGLDEEKLLLDVKKNFEETKKRLRESFARSPTAGATNVSQVSPDSKVTTV